ncbi:MAG: Hsp70 family protein [Streptococcus salivarius]
MRKKAIGIDLGTTNSVMAVVREDVPEIIPMGTNDDQVLRSAVYFSNISGQNHVSFGKEAIERGTEIGSTENFKFDFKRDIGRPIASDTPDHTRVNSIILSALVLNEFRKRAYVVGQEMGQADGIKDAVITVPAYFTSDQRAATKNAGRIAGFNVLRIINEPTAAAIAYAHTKNAQGNVLVFDLGGGTFDVTIMRVADHAYDILATDGNSRLGGIDFDKRLGGYIMQELEKQGVNMTNLSEKEKIQLQYKAEQIKTSLSVNDQALYEHYVNGQGYGVLITQAIFNEITLDLLKDTEIKVQSTLQASGLKWEEIDHILLVGGSTRMPMIRQMIRLMSGLEPKFDLNPDTIVAQGASILADLIVNNEVSFSEHQDGKTTETDRVVVKDVTSQGIGLLFKKNPNKNYSFVGDYYNSVVVPRNSVLPLAVTKDLFAVVDGQSKFKLRITEGNYENPFAVKILGQVEGQVPQPRQKGELLAQVTYAFDSEQIVTVTVSDPRSNTVVARFSVNAQVNQTQEVVKEDLSELQAIFAKFIS